MRCQVLYFTFQRSIPPLSPHHQQMGPRNHQKFNKCVSSSHAEPTTTLMITSMLPCARWAISLESGATCNIAESSTATNQPTHSHSLSLSLSLSLTQQKCSAHEHDSALIRLLERISKEIPTDLHVLLLFQVAMA
jgi:hypothetical protein